VPTLQALRTPRARHHTPSLTAQKRSAGAGGDGVVNLWDGGNKKRLHQVAGYPTSVAALAFNGAATKLAVASSYAFEQASGVAVMWVVGWRVWLVADLLLLVCQPCLRPFNPCWTQGEKEHPADAIFVRDVAEAEVRPKQRQPPAA
jgi:cell cycle arrest protein BUB3